MKTDDLRESSNVEDRRGGGSSSMGGGGGRGLGGRNIGIGTIAIALAASYFFGINPMTVLGILGGGDMPAPQVSQQSPAKAPPKDDVLASFVSKTLGSTEDVWGKVFQAGGQTYKQPKLEIFRGSTPTACGAGQAAMGPFYCPADQKVYIDLGFYDTLKTKLGAPGDFAQAYVIAHEVGHHVQNVLGISGKVDAMRGRISAKEQNVLSVRLELQADCFAGVWANHANKEKAILQAGDVEEAMNAAAQIGDDNLQRKSQGQIVPDSFTHGTSAQRQKWFNAGLQSGNMKSCDTFSAKAL
jgi:uncharacterized protein